jgi:menaquinone-dependent protoporphyrinogen oxidase
MGGTAGIAERVAETLRDRGLEVTVLRARQVRTLDGYDAALVGSAIYAGQWRGEAVRLLRRMARAEAHVPLWLFHSGPLEVEDVPETQALPDEVGRLAETLHAREAVTFGGRLPEHPKGFVAKLMARKRAGDWRDFDRVADWANGVADALLAS